MQPIIPRLLTFADYMEQALYGPGGYYASGLAHSGRQGDYFTAPDVGPAFGQLLALQFRRWQKQLSLTALQLVEVGAGDGELARTIREGLTENGEAIFYAAVERSPARRRALREIPGLRVFASVEELPPIAGCIFGNELIDAFPVHRVRRHNGRLEEAYVECCSESATQNPGLRTQDCKFAWGDPSTPRLQAYLDRVGIELPEGYETEINLAMADCLKTLSTCLARGVVLLIDYGRPAREYYAPERDRGTLRAFRNHRVGGDVLASEPMDLTADVDFTSLALDACEAGMVPLAFMEMGSFLLQAARAWGDTSPPADMRRSLRYLVHPEGLGGAFQALVLGKGVSPGELIFEHNRLSRLGLRDIGRRQTC